MLVISVLNRTTGELVSRKYDGKRKVGPKAICSFAEYVAYPGSKMLIEINPNVDDFGTYVPFKD